MKKMFLKSWEKPLLFIVNHCVPVSLSCQAPTICNLIVSKTDAFSSETVRLKVYVATMWSKTMYVKRSFAPTDTALALMPR